MSIPNFRLRSFSQHADMHCVHVFSITKIQVRLSPTIVSSIHRPPYLVSRDNVADICAPDGTEVETQVDNFATAEEGMAFIEGESFSVNPIGVDFDPDILVQRVRSGEDEAVIKKRPDIGPRFTRLEKAGVFS